MTSAPSATGRPSGIPRREIEGSLRAVDASRATVAVRAQNVAIALLLAVYLLVGWHARFPLLIGAGDELVYWSLSHSLESGQYRELYQVSAPLHIRYPPGYPAWLVVVRHVVGERIDLVPLVNLGLVAAAVLALTLVTRRLIGGWPAVGMLSALALNPALLAAGGSVFSEALYLALSSGCFVAAFLARDRSDWRVWLAITLALFAFLTRLVGVACVIGVGVWLLSRRRRSELVAFAVAATLVVGGWFAYTAAAPATVNTGTYVADFMSSPRNQQPTAVVSMARRVWKNSLTYGVSTLPSEMGLLARPDTPADNLFWLAVGGVALAFGVPFLWRTWRALAASLIAYLSIIIAWAWPVPRFVWPLVPFAILSLVLGGALATRRLPPRWRTATMTGLVALLVLGAAHDARARAATWTACERLRPEQGSRCFTSDVQALIAAADYIGQHAAPTDVVLTYYPAPVNFVSGRLTEAATTVDAVPKGALASTLRARGIRRVLLAARYPFERRLAAALLDACHDVRVDARFPAQTFVLSIAPETAPPADDACDALRDYQRATQPSGQPP